MESLFAFFILKDISAVIDTLFSQRDEGMLVFQDFSLSSAGAY